MNLFGMRVIFILGIVNLLTGLLILLSCRCLTTSQIGKTWMQHSFYKRFFKYHCYIWWIFMPSVIIHVIFAFGVFGIPF